MNSYRLEEHLKIVCEQNARYENLYSTWTLNKRTCSDLLKNVVIQYPHFSMHDASHSDTVISNIEMLLGERVKNLSPTDTWLLLHAAYAHDLGMVIQWKALEDTWTQPSFQEELDHLETFSDNDLCKAVQFIRSTHSLKSERTWPLKASRYVRLINAAIFRGKHAQTSQEYIDYSSPEFGLDLGHNGMIQSRIIKLLGQICMLHTMPLNHVMSLDPDTNGYKSDYAHPRFIAMMLRLGDLLDIDNGRFNTGSIAVAGGLPEASRSHYEKHEATTHILITPSEICFRSNCPDNASYLEARTFVNWLEQEVNFLTINWSKIAPDDLGGYAPHFDNKELLIDGVPDIEGVAGLKLTISQEKAFQIIEGASIYDDSLVFLREVLQNALDATKLQLWNDLCDDTYMAWMGSLDKARLQTLQPYDIDQKIYDNYPITVEVSTIDDNHIKIQVTDRGTGIAVEDFKRMCNVGESFESCKQLRNTINEMPNWLRPTAGFGIGLQSIFLVADKFTIDTCTGQEAYHAVIYSRKKGGYLQLAQTSATLPRGTIVCIETNIPKNLIQSSKNILHPIKVAPFFDPMDSGNIPYAHYLLNIAFESFEAPLFPLFARSPQFTFPFKRETNNAIFSIGKGGWALWENRYWYKWIPTKGFISIWDTKEAVLETLDFSAYQRSGNAFRFKGVVIGSFGSPCFPPFTMDIYGMDTKNNITLNRASFTTKGKHHLERLHRQNVRIACDVLLHKLRSNHSDPYLGFAAKGVFRNLDSYLLWLLCDTQQRPLIPQKAIQVITTHVRARIRIKRSNKYKESEIPVRNLILNTIEDTPCCLSSSRNSDHLDFLFPLENAAPNLIITDSALIDNLSHSYYLKTLAMGKVSHISMTYCTWQDSISPIEVSPSMRSRIVLSMSRNSANIDFTTDLSLRSATFAIKGYDSIAVDSLPAGVRKPVGLNSAWMVCPFTSNDEDKRKMQKWSKEIFIRQILTSESFLRVVDWVEHHSIYCPPPSRDEIIKNYKALLGEYYDVAEKVDNSAPNSPNLL